MKFSDILSEARTKEDYGIPEKKVTVLKGKLPGGPKMTPEQAKRWNAERRELIKKARAEGAKEGKTRKDFQWGGKSNFMYCEKCGELFQAKHLKEKYCPKCKPGAGRTHTNEDGTINKECSKCGKTFKAGSNRAKVCPECTAALRKETQDKNNARQKAKKEYAKEQEKLAQKGKSICKIQGCDEPVAKTSGRGRKPVYCEKHLKEKKAALEAGKGKKRGRKKLADEEKLHNKEIQNRVNKIVDKKKEQYAKEMAEKLKRMRAAGKEAAVQNYLKQADKEVARIIKGILDEHK